MVQMISERIVSPIVLTELSWMGFRAPLPQAEALMKMLDNNKLKIDHVLYFSVDSKILLERIKIGLLKHHQRSDVKTIMKKR